jgi:hypothetical protein
MSLFSAAVGQAADLLHWPAKRIKSQLRFPRPASSLARRHRFTPESGIPSGFS